jgi:hypothetical protein
MILFYNKLVSVFQINSIIIIIIMIIIIIIYNLIHAQRMHRGD